MMRKNRLFIILLFIFTLSFSSVSFGASQSGNVNTFCKGFPLTPNYSFYNSVDTAGFFNFVSSIDDFVNQSISAFANNRNITLDSEDVSYILCASSGSQFHLFLWHKNYVPDLSLEIHDEYNQLVFTPSMSTDSDNFGIGLVSAYCSSSSSKINYTFSSTKVVYAPGYWRYYIQSDNTHKYPLVDNAWYSSVFPIAQRGAELPFSAYGDNLLLFMDDNSGSDTPDLPEEESDIIIPELPEDTDSNIITLIKSIASFFGQLVYSLKGMFQKLIDSISSFFNELFNFFSNLFSDLTNSVTDILNSIKSFFAWVTDFSVDKNIVTGTRIYSLYNKFRILSEKFDFSDVSVPESVCFTINFSDSNTILSSIGAVDLNFDWYESIRDYCVPMFIAFLYIRAFWRLFTEIPSLISGLSGTKED